MKLECVLGEISIQITHFVSLGDLKHPTFALLSRFYIISPSILESKNKCLFEREQHHIQCFRIFLKFIIAILILILANDFVKEM